MRIEPPKHLTKNAIAAFHETCNRVAQDGRDPIRFVDVIAMYAEAITELRALTKSVAIAGQLLTAESGRKYVNPALIARDGTHQRVERLAKELGLSPNSPVAMDSTWNPRAVETLEEIEMELAEEALAEKPVEGDA